ncbi:phosphate ABC transporter permease PstA [Nocardioides alcanivorans]|uniref:phosphate ABC transporter permease PstA n=1 Tax=Nocardioides alcanivorans TaxID=2897352 RepID=UPI001F44CE0B|nr:phosphate ABC transporter permease PstA [Nocardioides alcanivorans]
MAVAASEPTRSPGTSGTTEIPTLPPGDRVPHPIIGLGKPNLDDRAVRWGSWVAALALAWVITARLLPLTGPAWFAITWFVCGLLMIALTTALTGRAVDVTDRVVEALITGAAGIVGFALVSIIVFVVLRGWEPLVHWNFFTEDMAGTGPRDPFTQGGVLHAIVGSLIQIGIAVAITVPLGIGTAVFMTEVGGRFAKVVRTVVEAMTALPSIVAGLFIYAVLIVALGVPKSGLAAALALAVMMLPIIARAADVVLRVVPGNLREASLALGASRWRTVWHVVLPTARPGLATALILGVARGVGETSPVLLTSGAAMFLVADPTDGVMNSLPLYIFSTVRSGEPMAEARAFAAATVLLGLVLVLFVIARLLARPRSNRTRLRHRLGGLVPSFRRTR